jgi:hypothetical protein
MTSFPKALEDTQIISRVYSWARGVVGMQYLATEAGYKAWHAAHARVLTEMLFSKKGVDFLHDLIVKKKTINLADLKTMVGSIAKAFRITEDGERPKGVPAMEDMMARALNSLSTLVPVIGVPFDPSKFDARTKVDVRRGYEPWE